MSTSVATVLGQTQPRALASFKFQREFWSIE